MGEQYKLTPTVVDTLKSSMDSAVNEKSYLEKKIQMQIAAFIMANADSDFKKTSIQKTLDSIQKSLAEKTQVFTQAMKKQPTLEDRLRLYADIAAEQAKNPISLAVAVHNQLFSAASSSDAANQAPFIIGPDTIEAPKGKTLPDLHNSFQPATPPEHTPLVLNTQTLSQLGSVLYNSTASNQYHVDNGNGGNKIKILRKTNDENTATIMEHVEQSDDPTLDSLKDTFTFMLKQFVKERLVQEGRDQEVNDYCVNCDNKKVPLLDKIPGYDFTVTVPNKFQTEIEKHVNKTAGQYFHHFAINGTKYPKEAIGEVAEEQSSLEHQLNVSIKNAIDKLSTVRIVRRQWVQTRYQERPDTKKCALELIQARHNAEGLEQQIVELVLDIQESKTGHKDQVNRNTLILSTLKKHILNTEEQFKEMSPRPLKKYYLPASTSDEMKKLTREITEQKKKIKSLEVKLKELRKEHAKRLAPSDNDDTPEPSSSGLKM